MQRLFRLSPGHGLTAVVVAVLVVFGGCSDTGDATLPDSGRPALDAYIRLQAALAADDTDVARSAADRMRDSANGELATLAAAVESAHGLAEQRETFAILSAKLIEQLRLPEGYMTAHCPMAREQDGADWIQVTGDIRNPYFGSAMLTCGVRTDDLK